LTSGAEDKSKRKEEEVKEEKPKEEKNPKRKKSTKSTKTRKRRKPVFEFKKQVEVVGASTSRCIIAGK
jgi:hypothetical protein